MIRHNRSSLSVFSRSRSVAEITAVLGLEPDKSAEKGAPTRAALAGRDVAPERLVRDETFWSLSADPAAADPEDETGFRSLRVLVDVLREKASALAALRADGETVIHWSGGSDSGQGGFVLPADLIADLAALGCDLVGTAFLSEPDDDEDDEDDED